MKYANTKVASKRQEKRIAKEMNARVTIASGALDFQKADVRNDLYLVEAKTTEKPYYPLTLTTWKKIEDQALKDGLRVPVMCVDLEDGKNAIAILSVHDFVPLKDENSTTYRFFRSVPSLYAKKSVRICNNHMEVVLVDDSNTLSITYQHLFFDDKTELVILDWNDFLLIQGGTNE